MTQEEKIALLEETFEVEEGTLTPETVLADVEEYTSLVKLGISVLFMDNFGTKLTGDDFKTFVTVGDILERMTEE